MPATLVEIAKAAGVSISTVSRVLNNTDHAISEKTRETIRRLADQMGYKPNLLARGLQAQQSRIAGIIVDNIDSHFAPPIVRAIQDRLGVSGYSTTIINSDYYPQVERDAIGTLLSFPVDGIIFVDTWLHSQEVDLPLTDKPFIFVNRISEGSDVNFVEPDDYYGAQLATTHLIQLGHRRIAYINGPMGWKASRSRLEGYRATLEAAGIPFDPSLVKVGSWWLQDGYRLMKEILALSEPPSAVFAGNDDMAIGAIYAAQDAGLRVPEDLAVVGYDNSLQSRIVRPNLTTVTMPVKEMGLRAAELFLHRVNHEAVPAGMHQVRGQLIVRQSCGSPLPSPPEAEPRTSTWSRFEHLSRLSREDSTADTAEGSPLEPPDRSDSGMKGGEVTRES